MNTLTEEIEELTPYPKCLDEIQNGEDLVNYIRKIQFVECQSNRPPNTLYLGRTQLSLLSSHFCCTEVLTELDGMIVIRVDENNYVDVSWNKDHED
jgi:hypothetical protein